MAMKRIDLTLHEIIEQNKRHGDGGVSSPRRLYCARGCSLVNSLTVSVLDDHGILDSR